VVDYFALLAGVSVVLSIFMMLVTIRAVRKGGMRIFKYLAGSFALILVTNAIVIFDLFYPAILSSLVVPGFIIADLLILLLFYSGIVRGT